MKRVDHMIKYLAGDLSREESLAFEKELSENQKLKNDFSEVSLAYRVMAEQIKREDEDQFTRAVSAAMEKAERRPLQPLKRTSRRWISLLALAASLAIIISIFSPHPGMDRIYKSSYNPPGDPVIQTLGAHIRGKTGHQAISDLWNNEHYAQCRNSASRVLSENASDEFAMLFYLLSSMELNEAAGALEKMQDLNWSRGESLGQAISWYRALALIKAGLAPEAIEELTSLEAHSGPYQKDAHKLKKKLRK